MSTGEGKEKSLRRDAWAFGSWGSSTIEKGVAQRDRPLDNGLGQHKSRHFVAALIVDSSSTARASSRRFMRFCKSSIAVSAPPAAGVRSCPVVTLPLRIYDSSLYVMP
jgi:hypothetical protein